MQKDKKLTSDTNRRYAPYAGKEVLLGPKCFNLISYCAEWLDIGAESKATLSVLLTYVIETSCTKVETVDGGNVLELQVTWPSPFQEARKLFKSFIEDSKLPEYTLAHPEVITMQGALKNGVSMTV